MLTREITSADRWRTSLVAAPMGAEYSAKVSMPYQTASTGGDTLGVATGNGGMLGVNPSDEMTTGSLPGANSAAPEDRVNRAAKGSLQMSRPPVGTVYDIDMDGIGIMRKPEEKPALHVGQFFDLAVIEAEAIELSCFAAGIGPAIRAPRNSFRVIEGMADVCQDKTSVFFSHRRCLLVERTRPDGPISVAS